jgi:hypothetical protein
MSIDAGDAIRSQSELGGRSMGGADADELARQAVTAGASSNHIDADELLSYIRSLEARVQQVEDERAQERDAGKPDLVQTAELILGHVAHRASALGKGSVLDALVPKAADLVEAAKRAVDTGDGSEVSSMAGALAAGITRVASAAASADVSYPLQLVAEDLPAVVAKLRKSSTVRGEVLSSHTAAPARQLGGYRPVR